MSKIWQELDLIDNIKELNKHVGSMVYILLYSDNMVGTTKIVDMNKYLMSENILKDYLSDNEGVMLLHALVLNQKELPDEIPIEVDVLYDMACLRITLSGVIEFEEKADIEDVIDYIEDEVDKPHVSIDDFAVILYKKVPFMLQIETPSTDITYSQKKEMGVCK